MKKFLFAFSFIASGIFSVAQTTATNFNCNDCAGANHDLFTELNAGKVVVICWVMPCGSCIPGALAAQSACQSFASSHPGQVAYYCVDDYANTSCSTIAGWCTTNGITTATQFSNSAIDMTDYGTAGMPKVVVLGDTTHTVYYNQNDATISTSGIQSAINNALTAIAQGVNEVNSAISTIGLYPNPVTTTGTIRIELEKETDLKIELQNYLGQKVAEVFNGKLTKGENKLNLDLSSYANGSYFINICEGNRSRKMKLMVIH